MSSIYGENIHLSIFGQSHSEAIGMSLDGIPAGQSVDLESLNAFLARRAPGNSDLSTPRKEADTPEFLSGFTYPASSSSINSDPGTETAAGNPTHSCVPSDNDSRKTAVTCGAPIAAIIRNTNTRSKDYSELKITPRPGHADYTAEIKYHGAQDYAGGGHFSGRLTAPLCIAGGICMQFLEKENIHIFTRIYSISDIRDGGSFEAYLADRYAALSGTIGTSSEKTETSSYTTVKNELLSRSLPVINEAAGEKMRELILEKKKEGDSVGGIIECVVTGLPAGLGDPMFDGMENRISQAVFAIPAVKGIEFGAGFASAYMTGSENNDGFRIAGLMTGSENNDSFRIAGSMNESGNNKKIITETNNCGGILGGITNGMPLVFRAAFKPTPSIAKEQRSVNLPEMKDTALTVHGRHDPCIVPRALPCVEAAAALAIYDAYLGRKKEMPGG